MESSEITLKIALIGPSAVGKTSIIQRFYKNTFVQLNPTINGSCVKKDVVLATQTITLEIWDTAGQEKYRSLGPLFFRDALLCIAVFDATSEESYSQIPEFIGDYKDCGENGKIFICANKIDDVDIDNCPLIDKAKQYSKENDYGFYLTSAKTGQGVDELFIAVATTLASQIHDLETTKIKTPKKKDGCC